MGSYQYGTIFSGKYPPNNNEKNHFISLATEMTSLNIAWRNHLLFRTHRDQSIRTKTKQEKH